MGERSEVAVPQQLSKRAIQWVIYHDDSRVFTVLYIGLAVVLSIWISLFWLVAVVAVQLAFELVRQRSQHANWGRVVGEALWELKLDLALVLFAMVVALYMEIVLGMAGLQGAARLGSAARLGRAAQVSLRGGARFAAWQRLIRGVLLSVDDAAQAARVVFARKGNQKAAGEAHNPTPLEAQTGARSWLVRWSKGDWIAVGLAAVCVLLLLAAPLLTEQTYDTAWAALAAELQPFLGD